MSDLKQEIVAQAINSTPSVAFIWCTAILSITINQWLAVFSIAYIILQAAYLIWKWVREVRKGVV